MGLDRVRRYGFTVVGGNHVNADLTSLADEIVDHRSMYHLEPARAARLANGDLGDVVGSRVGNDLFGDVAARDRDRRSAEPLGQPQKVSNAITFGVIEALRPSGLDVNRCPWRT